MSLHLKKFQTTSQYEQYINSGDAILPNVSLCEDTKGVHYNPVPPQHDYTQDYFTMVVTSGGTIKWSGSTTANRLFYSKDNGENWSGATSATTISVKPGDKILWKGTPTPQSANRGIGRFSGITYVRYSVEGNAMSLLYGDDFKGQTSLGSKIYALYGLFGGNTNVTNAENLKLPATTLTTYCYGNMFGGCTNLTTAPELPATTLAQNCYQIMFQGCTGLTAAPELPATTLAENCYVNMFNGCKSLTVTPELPATTLATNCYGSMFSNTNVLPDCTNIDFSSQSVVTSGGLKGLFIGTNITDAQLDSILKEHGINNYSLPVTTLTSYCYYSMFSGCTSLMTAPELPATTLATQCYREMFYGCTSLSSIKCLATDISASSCTSNWVKNVAANGTFTKAASMNDWTEGANGIPSGWSVQDAS